MRKHSINILICGFLFCLVIPLAAQDNSIRVFDSYQGQSGIWMKYQDVSQSWYQHIFRMIDQSFAYDDQMPVGKSSWVWQKEVIRHRLKNSIGEFPEKTPLNAKVTEILHRETFTVEKLLYESLPGFYVTAALFIPRERQRPAPAIIYCSGHSREGFRSPIYQHVIINLVQKGFIVLAFDPIGQGERYQYLDDDGQAGMQPTYDHSYSGVPALMVNNSLAKYMIVDGIRAVDYLISRPEVDSTRIGITGRSGGGTQTTYIAAFDQRIHASAPENFVTSTRRLWESIGPQDAEQNLPYARNLALDHKEMLMVRVPKPTLIITTSRDYFSIQGARETFEKVKKVYERFGAGDHIRMAQDDYRHGSTESNRMAMYAFFQQYLQLPGEPLDQEAKIFTEEELTVTTTGQVVSALQSKTIFDLNHDRGNPPAPAWENKEDARQKLIESVGISQNQTTANVVFTGQVRREGYHIQKYFIEFVDEHYPIPFLVVKNPDKEPSKIVLFLDSRDKARQLEPGGEMEKLVKAGYTVIAPDLLNVGELASAYEGDSHISNVSFNLITGSNLVGKSLAGLQTEDLLHLLSHIKEKFMGQNQQMEVIAEGELCLPLLYLTVMEEGIFEKMILKKPLVSWSDLLQTRHYQPHHVYTIVPGALLSYDLPDLMALKPAPMLTILNPVHADGRTLTGEEARKAYVKVQMAFGEGKLEIITE